MLISSPKMSRLSHFGHYKSFLIKKFYHFFVFFEYLINTKNEKKVMSNQSWRKNLQRNGQTDRRTNRESWFDRNLRSNQGSKNQHKPNKVWFTLLYLKNLVSKSESLYWIYNHMFLIKYQVFKVILPIHSQSLHKIPITQLIFWF